MMQKRRWPVFAVTLLVGSGLIAQSFARDDFLAAMTRLHEFYLAPAGLQRPDGLSIGGGPDFTGIATWIFDVYLTCRAGGKTPDASFIEVTARITQSDEWKTKHPGEAPRPSQGCTSPVQLSRQEFLQAMQRLDAFYRAPEGLQRSNGLSFKGAPDFLGIAAWVFDVYLNARLAGRPIEVAWGEVVRNIEASGEWKAKHADTVPLLRFAVVGDYGIAGDAARDVALLIKSWSVDLVLTTGDNNYPNGAAATIDTNIGQYYADFIFPYTGSFSSTSTRNRFFPAMGNHEWESSGALPYLNYFTLPGNERYYELVQAPVHFFAIDSDPHEPDGTAEGSVQGQWLRGRLAASTSPYRVVFMHHPPFSSSVNGSTALVQWPYQSWGASVVIAGHDHIYERVMRDGIPYFVNGAGGYPLYPLAPPVAGSMVRFNADYGAMLVEVSKSRATFEFITRAGVVVDTHTVAPR